MLLPRLLAALSQAHVSGPTDIDITDIVYDSRRATPGCLFAAVPKVGGDGRGGGLQYVPEAIRRGATTVLVQAVEAVEGVTTIHVADARAALADVAAEFFGQPSRALQLFAVTGTDGKTTTTYLLEQILSSSGYCTGLIGTVEIKIGSHRQRNLDRMTTPESPDVQRLLRGMAEAGVTHVALEASSHALALQRLRGCAFAACALTNITADHVEFHGTWERYFLAKAGLFTDLAPDRPSILNRDDTHFDRLRSMVSGPVTTYGLHPEADLRATRIEPQGHATRFEVTAGREHAEMAIPLAGTFNVSNALAAAGLARQAGVSLAAVADGLSRATPPPGRMERVQAGQPFEVVVDYAHTMHAFRTVLSILRAGTPPPGRLIAVFGATGDRDRSKRPELARIAREYTDFFIITNEDPYGERPESIMAEVAAGVPREEEGQRFVREEDRAHAIECALRRARPGDTIAILGKGHEQSMVVNGRKKPWSDSAVARRALEALA